MTTKELLIGYLSTMGRCGRHYTLHEHVYYHNFDCRRAQKAIELVETAKKDTFYDNYENPVSPTQITSGSALYINEEIKELVECLNGGLYYGQPSIYLEGPDIYDHLPDYGIPELALVGSHEIEFSKGITLYKQMLGNCLDLIYNFQINVDISLENLYAAGLQDDKPWDYEDF